MHSTEKTQNWGYAIYRTVYTPESDILFPRVLEKLGAFIKREIESDLQDDPLFDPAPNHEVWSRYKSTIIDSRDELNGISLDDVRLQFRQMVEEQGRFVEEPETSNKICLVIDDEVLQIIAQSHEPGEPTPSGILMPYVKVVDAKFGFDGVNRKGNSRTGPSKYPGWMKADLNVLWKLWILVYGDGMEKWCPPMTIFDFPSFDG